MTKFKLTDKQERFISEYLIDLNAHRRLCGQGIARKQQEGGYENLTKPHTQEAIQKVQSERNERLKTDADYVLRRHIEIDQMDIAHILDSKGHVLPIVEWPECWRQTISGIDISEVNTAKGEKFEVVIKKIKWPDKLRNIELLGKHVSIQAYSNNHTLTKTKAPPVESITYIEEDARKPVLQ